MQSLTIPSSSSYFKFYENDQKFKRESKGLDHNQIALIKYISSLLSIKEFRDGYGYPYKILNNLIIDFFNLNNKCFISREAFYEIERKKIFISKDQILKKDILKNNNDFDFVYLIPIKKISKELIYRKLHLIQIKNLLINSTTKVLVNNKEKDLIKNVNSFKKQVFDPTYKINNSEIEKILGIKINNSKYKLIN